ncbi:hypothetical protein ISF_03299 [Cordyceps fumosorosea ARSEF 2679]|uniref:Uncharacterized protein n=1 Tax=Cordyceps fumosorosea (strain ARSEF 2679) TaxID=1081104 RepID=A0A162LD64_CORFA|nr:hypothetical protein ISF_03299 [Cordyceps fumosorosea ARSEF 2679]OAA68924.1 hypothetical protein ISF_03299 [Cordyceps fumosorosea ARSEF 2679]
MPKRRRTASPPLARESSAVTQPHILPPNTQPPGGEDDKAYQLYLERAFADPRFRSTVAQIFNKYDGKTARADETIDPVLGRTYTGDGSAAGPAVGTQLDSLAHNDHLPYHLDMRQCEPKQEDTETADYQAGLNEPHGPYATGTAHLGTAPPGYVPNFADGGMPPGYAQSWYGNPFQGSGAYPSQWAGFTGQYSTPNGPPVTAGPWTAPDNFTYNSTAWPPHAMQPSPPTCHIDPALEMFVEAKNEEGTYHFAQEEESTGSYEPVTEYYFDALGRKRRRRLAQPRFSKNGRRLGRPPKSAEELGISTDRGAHDGEGEEEKNSARVVDLKPPTSEFCDDDDDTLWGELAEALQLASKATSKKRNNNSTKPSQKGENSATESDGAAEAEKDTDQGEMMLQKIQQELIDRAVRRSIAKENGDDTDVAAEGRRRSGRERKPANFGEQVSWDKVSAERRTSYKIKMHLRALSVQARRERKRKEKEEAEAAAKEKEEADKARKEKQEAEELAAATAAAAAAEKDDMGESNKAMPSTIPDSQDTVTSLPIRTTPKKPQSTQIMRQTIKNHVNSVVHFEEDDEALSDHEASAAFSIKDPAFSFKKPEIRVHSFLGENYMDTVYALSDDEAPTLLASMKRVSLGKKKKLQLGPAAVRPKETANVAMQNCPESSKHITASEEAEHHASKAPSPSPDIDTDAVLNSITDTAAVQEPPCKATESDDTTGSSIPSGGDGDDSGIDIRSEQTSCERSNRPPARDPIPAVPLFQDQNLLGAEHILDSLDVMSEAEETASSPVSEYGLATEDTQMNDADPFTSNVPASSRSTDKPPFVDEVPMYESMDTFEDLPADIPLMSEEVEMGYDQPVEPTVKALEQNTAREKSAKKQTAQGPPEAQKELPNARVSIATSAASASTAKQVTAELGQAILVYVDLEDTHANGNIKGTIAQQHRRAIEAAVIELVADTSSRLQIWPC